MERRFVSFVTCVRNRQKYAECRRSIDGQLSSVFEVETIDIDNSSDEWSLPQALNAGRERAGGEILVFCHEDVTFPPAWLDSLGMALADIEERDPSWGVVGPMGRLGKRFYGHAEDASGEPAHFGPLPARVDTLDEFCLVVKRDLPLSFDEKLGGHHLYGVDLCIQAHEAGLGCWAVDLRCRHASATRHRPPAYHRVKRKLQRKWMFRRRRTGRSVGTTCGRIRFGVFEGWL